MKEVKRGEARRIAFFLPNIFTALNMACGFGSVLMTFQGNFYLGTILIFIGAIFDLVDGRIARLTGTTSQFGEQFDSMSDLISFGFAPSVLMYNFFLSDLGRPGQVVAFVFLLCGALRLARFNANIEKVSAEFFQGLPIPGGAAALSGLVFMTLEYPQLKEYKVVAPFYILFYSILMISNIPFTSFKNSDWAKKHKRAALFIVFILIALLFAYEEIMIFSYISLYVVGSMIYFFIKKGELGDVFHWKGESEPND